jgi:hypothetical protein
MMSEGFSYIAIDPNIDLSLLSTKAKSYKLVQYDFNKICSMQVTSIARATVLWCKSKSEDFVRMTMPIMVMNSIGMPAVFSFGISYHISSSPC